MREARQPWAWYVSYMKTMSYVFIGLFGGGALLMVWLAATAHAWGHYSLPALVCAAAAVWRTYRLRTADQDLQRDWVAQYEAAGSWAPTSAVGRWIKANRAWSMLALAATVGLVVVAVALVGPHLPPWALRVANWPLLLPALMLAVFGTLWVVRSQRSGR
jgi:hypothetical protein